MLTAAGRNVKSPWPDGVALEEPDLADAGRAGFSGIRDRILGLGRRVLLPAVTLVAGGLFVEFLWTNWPAIVASLTPQMVLEFIGFSYVALVVTIVLALLDGLGRDVGSFIASSKDEPSPKEDG